MRLGRTGVLVAERAPCAPPQPASWIVTSASVSVTPPIPRQKLPTRRLLKPLITPILAGRLDGSNRRGTFVRQSTAARCDQVAGAPAGGGTGSTSEAQYAHFVAVTGMLLMQ